MRALLREQTSTHTRNLSSTASLTSRSATKNADLSEGIHEDVSSDLAREHGTGDEYHSLLASHHVGMLDKLGGSVAKTLGSDAKNSSVLGNSLEAGTSKSTNSTDFTEGMHEDAQQGVEKAKHTSTGLGDSLPKGSFNASNNGGGVFEQVKAGVSGVFGGESKPKSESVMAAGASSGIKNTDLTDGIYEDAKKGIESVKGATARP